MTLPFWQKASSEAGGGMTGICTHVYHTADFNSYNFSISAHVSDNSSTNRKKERTYLHSLCSMSWQHRAPQVCLKLLVHDIIKFSY